ncbi:MAG: hypothetical protein JXK05_09635 [Campylobacterales bacterium]|nr:hypothetical protein [Campylobacterales bacterium]
MATTVNGAFTEFNRDYVNLDSERTKTARKSRNWLIEQLCKLPTKILDFPFLYDEKHIKFGSFARNTKIRELDDIDLLLAFKASGATYTEYSYGKEYVIHVPEDAKYLWPMCDDGILNSRKLINKLVSGLSEIEHYKKADIHRRQEAATLSLTSYEWNFDIVPAFFTTADFYLIPDGSGNWKATDPRVDQTNVSSVNQKHNGKILQIIRTLKYWQKRPTMPTMSSYLFEIMILNFYDSKYEVSEYIDFELRDFWSHLENAIYNPVMDPKGFQGDINTHGWYDRQKISEKAKESYDKAKQAISFETNDQDMRKAIAKWREIFGSDFPQYG